MRFIKRCPACQEMKKLGLTFEETHSSHVKGHIIIEDKKGERLIKSPHSK